MEQLQKESIKDRNEANIEKKRSVLHFVEFHQYEFDYHGRTFEVKLALCERGV